LAGESGWSRRWQSMMRFKWQLMLNVSSSLGTQNQGL
jgi:hypothetical protein